MRNDRYMVDFVELMGYQHSANSVEKVRSASQEQNDAPERRNNRQFADQSSLDFATEGHLEGGFTLSPSAADFFNTIGQEPTLGLSEVAGHQG